MHTWGVHTAVVNLDEYERGELHLEVGRPM